MNSFFYILNFIAIAAQNLILKITVFLLYRKPNKDVKELLIFRSGGLGDFIFSLPAINMIHEKYNKNLYFMTYAPSHGLHYKKLAEKKIIDLPWLEFLSHSKLNKIFILRNLSLKNISNFRKNFKDINIDGLIIMTHSGEPFISIFKKILLLRVIGIKNAEVTGWKQLYNYNLFRKYHTDWGYLDHKTIGPIRAVNSFFDIFNNKVEKIPLPKINISKKYLDNIRSFKHKYSLKRYVVICPGSIHEFKEWGYKNYDELIKLILSSDLNIKVIIAGPKSDFHQANILLIDSGNQYMWQVYTS